MPDFIALVNDNEVIHEEEALSRYCDYLAFPYCNLGVVIKVNAICAERANSCNYYMDRYLIFKA